MDFLFGLNLKSSAASAGLACQRAGGSPWDWHYRFTRIYFRAPYNAINTGVPLTKLRNQFYLDVSLIGVTAGCFRNLYGLPLAITILSFG